MSSKSKIPTSLNNSRFDINKKLGAGCFGEVYRGVDTTTKKEVAVKFEDVSCAAPQLEHEAQMLDLLQTPSKPQGFAECIYYGREGNYHCLVMEYLGKSLEDRVQSCGGKFTPKTACLVAEQVLIRIEYLHSKGVVHRDIKPENFMWGVGDKQHHIYLIDFGLSKRYWDKKHCQLKQKLSLTGTARYASLNAHRGMEQSRRDDLEAIGHMLIYFLKGQLPWSGLDAKSKQEKYKKIKEVKEQTKISDLCKGYPEAFETYLGYTRNLGFKDRPDYAYLRKLFSDLRAQLEKEEGKKIESWDFEWMQGKDIKEELVALLPYNTIQQPDDDQARIRPRGMCCFCGGGKVDD
jgi:serine/threonine protein kinase